MKECIPILPTRERPRYSFSGCSQRPTVQAAQRFVLLQPTDLGQRVIRFVWASVASQNLVETSNQPDRIKLGFEAQDGMAATWKVGTYLVSSFSAFTTLLVGLFALPIYPIVGALLVIGGMALQLYAVAALCGAAESKNDSREESNWGKGRD